MALSLLLVFFFFFVPKFVAGNQRPPPPPNILVIIADDLGWGDLGTYGNRTIPTPHIDRLAADGIQFNHHLTAASTCTPSRAALLTGRYAVRSGMAAHMMNRVILFVASTGGLPTRETSIAAALKSTDVAAAAAANYTTGLIGKWHLGNDCDRRGDGCHHPNAHGFDYFYGSPMTNLKDFSDDPRESVILTSFPNMYPVLGSVIAVSSLGALISRRRRYSAVCLPLFLLLVGVLTPLVLIWFQRNVTLLNSVLMRQREVIEQPIRMKSFARRITNEAIGFMERARAGESRPFFLMVTHMLVHTALVPSDEFAGRSSHGKFGDGVMELDHEVGRLLDHLRSHQAASPDAGRQLGLGDLERDTLVYFSSDNGGHLEELDPDGNRCGGHNGHLRGGKAHGPMEGGIRVPGILRWPAGGLRGGLRVDVPTSQLDLMPTLLEVAGRDPPTDRILDGKSWLPLLRRATASSSDVPEAASLLKYSDHHQELFHYCDSYLWGVRLMEPPTVASSGQDTAAAPTASQNPTGHIWKIYFYMPAYIPGAERCPYVCQCPDGQARPLDPPLIYDLAVDEREERPLDPSSPLYRRLLDKARRSVDEHQKSLRTDRLHGPAGPESQFTLSKAVWRPHLQPCCDPRPFFPYCGCSEEKESPPRGSKSKYQKEDL